MQIYANLFKINEKCHLSSIQKSQQICTSGGDVYYASPNLLSTCLFGRLFKSVNFFLRHSVYSHWTIKTAYGIGKVDEHSTTSLCITAVLVTNSRSLRYEKLYYVFFNQLKMIWFSYNTHFPYTSARVYSGLFFSGLKALFNNVITLKDVSCMSLHAISVFDKV